MISSRVRLQLGDEGIDRGCIEAPLFANSDAWKPTAVGHPIDRRAIHAQDVLHLTRAEERPCRPFLLIMHTLHTKKSMQLLHTKEVP